ncbi:hypothetical protein MMC20_002636 [Loxospora ochrophaea]|nr:hypothetical protein [Loxospora ochrophaea]
MNATIISRLHLFNPSFHVLIPASETNENLCKTLLSSFLLNYPPPTLINFEKIFTGDNWDKGSHAGKIQGVYDYLSNTKNVRDDDLVLVIDGYDVWFQLPPEVLIKRYHAVVRQADKRLKSRYGMTIHERPWEGKREVVQKFSQRVLFGADKLCWPNGAEDPACAAIPTSNLPENIYGEETDKDPEGYKNRPRFLNSGALIGPVAEVRAIYEYALQKVEEGRGQIGDQFVFAEIFGEQEYQREAYHKSYATASKLFKRLSSFLEANVTSHSTTSINNMTVVPGRHYEFGIGLDYGSNLFQTMTHSAADISFIVHNKSLTTATNDRLPSNLSFAPDIQSSRPPFLTDNPVSLLATSTLIPFSPNLDPFPHNLTWHSIPLATNHLVPTIPTLLHINGDKSLLKTWWQKMWFQPYSRALLRQHMRTPQEPVYGVRDRWGYEIWWDMRGGKGGAWTDNGVWMPWKEVCEGCEEGVFMDGKGVWGKEEGDGKILNYWGRVIVGDEGDQRG